MTTPRVAEADGDDEGDESPVYEINPEVTPPVAPSVMRVSAILWPAFLMAGVIEMLVFAMVDPGDLHWIARAYTRWRSSRSGPLSQYPAH